MKDCTVSKYPICTLLDEFFAQEEIRNVITEYQNKNSKISKWLMFSDYCLDDKNKSNDVMTFVLMPFESEAKYSEMQQKIHDMQPSDIKKTNTVNETFLSYLKSANVLVFSFVFEDIKHFFAPSHKQCLEAVKELCKQLATVMRGGRKRLTTKIS